ncbi:MAG TPA: DUF2804 domain-containing protein [Labilithrix sp.]|nr:DUF2804 domain-containing protein [Labilithrix sp.]
MRTLSPAPRAFVDPATGRPAFGSYDGSLPPVRFDATLRDEVFRRKKWVYVALASEQVWVSLAVVRLGYAANVFVFVFDRASRRMIVDRTVLGSPRAAVVADEPHASGLLARFEGARASVRIERRDEACDLRARFADLEIDAVLDESTAPPAVSAIADLGPSLVSGTEKRALATVRGHLVAAGRRVSLDGAFAGYDYTHGLLPRRTRWRWAFAMGHAKDGTPVGFNLVEGFVGEAECAAFLNGRVHPLPEPRFELEPERIERPWRLTGAGVDLTFEVGAVHEQRTNLVLVRSRFLQPVGAFRGTLRIAGRDVELDGVPGVVEDQDVLW